MNIEHLVRDFLHTKNLSKNTNILFALSGGIDSLALLYVLLAVRKSLPFTLHIAHINHGWRQASENEAAQLEQLARQYHLPFHYKKLDPQQTTGNLENFCRQQRQQFFIQLCRQYQLHAVLLAHQADDQAETILKRIFEGADLSKMQGMQVESKIAETLFWRPLLTIPKQILSDYLQKKQFTAFDDATNRDTHFLRARMRAQLLPTLEQQFGKSIQRNLLQLGNNATELDRFLQQQLKPYLAQKIKGPFGVYLAFASDMTLFAIKYLMRQLCLDEQITLPSAILLDKIAQQIQAKTANVTHQQGIHTFWIDRGHFFCLYADLPELPNSSCLLNGWQTLQWGPWQIKQTLLSAEQAQLLPSKDMATDWYNLWQTGCSAVLLPWQPDYYLALVQTNLCYSGQQAIRHFWNKQKVPAFLCQHMPVIYSLNAVKHEFLSGKRFNDELSMKMLQLQLCYYS